MLNRPIHGVIYAIKNINNEVLYIGNTRRIEDVSKRFSEHMRQIKNDKHKYISYSEYTHGLKYEILCLVYSDSFIVEMVENLYNSLLLPRNEIISKGSTYNRCSHNDADIILRDMNNSYIICRVDSLDIYGKSEILDSLLINKKNKL